MLYQNLMGQGNDGTLVSPAYDKPRIFALEHALSATSSVSHFAQQSSNVKIAFANASAFSFTGGFGVAGTDPSPRGQTLWSAKGFHLRTDLDSQHGCAHRIDSRNRLEKIQGLTVRLQFSRQLGVESSDTGFELTDVLEDFA
jgi:hypothetical protein